MSFRDVRKIKGGDHNGKEKEEVCKEEVCKEEVCKEEVCKEEVCKEKVGKKKRRKGRGEESEVNPIKRRCLDLCEDVSTESNGTAFLSFSRGKDSLAAWLVMREYFDRIIPVHFSWPPGISFVDESLNYYEDFFGEKIVRLVDPSLFDSLKCMHYQLIEDEPEIDSFHFPREYSKIEIFDFLRLAYDFPNAFVGYGINMCDSMTRNFLIKSRGAVNWKNKSFYPTFDLSRDEIIRIIEGAGIRLPADYRMHNRTFPYIMGRHHIDGGLEEMFPKDMKIMEMWFPLIKAELARNHFAKNHQEVGNGKEKKESCSQEGGEEES